MAEFAEVVYFRDPQKAAEMPKLEDRWSLGLWLGKSLASDEHYVGTSAGVRRCRSIWRRPENQRWSKKVLNESLEPNTVEGETTHTTRSVHHAGPSDQVWTHNRMPSMLRACESASSECRARFQDIVDSEAAQTGAAIAGDTSAEVWGQVPGNFATSSSSGPAPAAGRPAPEDVMEVVVESSTTQPTSSANWVLEADDHPSAKRQKVLAGMPTSDETDEDVNVDAYKIIVLAAMPDDREQWTQQIVDWDKKYFGTKSGTLLDTQKVYEGRLRELVNIEKLEVAETVPLQEARAQNLEVVYGKWLDDAKGTLEDPAAVRSRLVATQITYACGDVTQATPPMKASRIILSQAGTKTNAKGQHDCLIGRHDIPVAFFPARGSGRVVIVLQKCLAAPGIGWRAMKAWRDT